MMHLHILPNGRARFDDEPELDLVEFRSRLRILMQEDPRPDIAIAPNKEATYATVANVFAIFRDEGYGQHLGFVGMDKP